MAGIQLSGTIFGRSCSVLLERRSASRPWMAKRHIPPAPDLGGFFVCRPATVGIENARTVVRDGRGFDTRNQTANCMSVVDRGPTDVPDVTYIGHSGGQG